jgi:hypothetical protein
MTVTFPYPEEVRTGFGAEDRGRCARRRGLTVYEAARAGAAAPIDLASDPNAAGVNGVAGQRLWPTRSSATAPPSPPSTNSCNTPPTPDWPNSPTSSPRACPNAANGPKDNGP